jgi:hypothetical protein
MDPEIVAVRIQETNDRSLRNEGRIEKLEDEQDVLRKLATSVAVMAEQLKTINTNMASLTSKVDVLEAKPAKRWDAVVAAGISALVGALIGFILS